MSGLISIRGQLVACALAAMCLPVRAAAPGPASVVDPADRTAATSLVGRRLALVVGTSTYQNIRAWPALPNASPDANALGDELDARYGFLVTRLESPTVATFKTALRRLAQDAGPADDVLVFVAGHGHFDAEDKAGYLVFTDGAVGCGAGCYPLDNIKRALYDTRARHVLVMLDTCFAGTFDIRTAIDSGVPREGVLDLPLDQSLRDYARYPSRFLLASVGRAATTDGAPGMHSPFMRAVLRELARAGTTGVVSLDRLYVALSEDQSLAVARPATFGSVVPAHPSGTFLFIEEVALCEALEAFLVAGQGGFVAVRQPDIARAAWADVSAATWTLPGTRRCEVWQWRDVPQAPGMSAVQVRCDLGPYDRTLADAKARETFLALKHCQAHVPSEPFESARHHGATDHHDIALALPSRGRKLVVSSICADRVCTLTVIVE